MSLRVAVVQMGIGRDRQENLQHSLDMIDQAAKTGAKVILLPEFINHPSFYSGHEEAWERAEKLDGDFLAAIAERARTHDAYISATVTLRGQSPQIWDSQLLYDPAGQLVGRHDKEVLFGQENDFFVPGTKPAQVLDLPIGRVALYSCMDGVIPETTRVPSLAGAQLLLNSLNSCGRDEGELHIPVRAAENHVWLAAANKAWYDVPNVGRVYSGRSEVLDPHGRSLAKANSEGREEIVFADIDLSLADDKRLAGGGNLLADRQPAAYRVLAEPMDQVPFYEEKREHLKESFPVRLAVVQATTFAEAKHVAQDCGANVIALPERFDASIAQIQELAGVTKAYVGVSLVVDGADRGFLFDPRGQVVIDYLPVHPRPGTTQSGSSFQVADTEFGRIGLMVGRDGLFLESARVLACMGADIIVYPTTWTEEWEVELGVHARAAENHVSILAAARLDSPVAAGSILIPVVKREMVRGPNVILNRYEALHAKPGVPHVVDAIIDIADARVKSIFHRTDILAGRRPEHYATLVQPVKVATPV